MNSSPPTIRHVSTAPAVLHTVNFDLSEQLHWVHRSYANSLSIAAERMTFCWFGRSTHNWSRLSEKSCRIYPVSADTSMSSTQTRSSHLSLNEGESLNRENSCNLITRPLYRINYHSFGHSHLPHRLASHESIWWTWWRHRQNVGA